MTTAHRTRPICLASFADLHDAFLVASQEYADSADSPDDRRRYYTARDALYATAAERTANMIRTLIIGAA